MSYSITKTPRNVDFGRNPLGFTIKRPIVRQPRMQMGLGTNIAFPIGSTVAFYFSDKAVVFTVVASADNSGTQLSSTTDLATLIADLNKNTILNNNWILEQATESIFFYERDPLDYYSIEVVAPEGYFPVFYYTARYDGPICMVSELYLKQYGYSDFVSQGLSFHALDISGNAYINLKDKVLSGFAPYNPGYNQASVSEIVIPTYYLKIWEYKMLYGTLFQELYTTPVYKALFGKLSVSDFKNFTFNSPFHILSNAPEWRDIWSEAHNEISILITGQITSFSIKVKLYFDDETVATITFAADISCEQHKVYYIPAGVEQLGIVTNTPEGKICYRYEVIVDSGTDNVSKSYIIKDRPDFGRTLRFVNAMGGYDCFYALMHIADKRLVEVDTNEKSLRPSYTESTSIIADKYNTRDEFELKIKSLTTSEVNHLKELLDSPFVFMEKNNSWIPIVITSNSMDGPDEEDDLFDIKLNFRYA